MSMNRTSTTQFAMTSINQAPTPGLSPYLGAWNYAQAAHLLRRSMFGPTHQDIKDAVESGLEATLDLLFEEQELPKPPVNPYFQEDPNVPIGETWVNAPYERSPELINYRQISLRAWAIGTMLQEGVSIREKMTLFWHNHFAVSDIADPKFFYHHINLLRENALGNFKDLVKKVTIDPAMLRFLNGNQNTNLAPNENYARELLELFTVGKGDLAGPGDYSTFTEQDVAEIAKILTGWIDTGYFTPVDTVEVGQRFRPFFHDKTTKQLSHRFDNAIINNAEENEYSNLIDIIFQQRAAASYICRKLYRWFVYYDITDEVEVNVIEPMAQLLIDEKFEIKPVVYALLSSEHFFDILSQGPMIKNPIDFAVGFIKQFEVALPTRLGAQYTIWLTLFQFIRGMEMEYFAPPSVAGWKAYYQEPQYYRTWINATTLTARVEFTNVMSTVGYPYGGQRIQIDALEFLATIDNADDPNTLVREVAQILLPMPLTDSQYDVLKSILIPGLPDYEWTVEYGIYKSDPSNMEIANAVEIRVRLLLQYILNLPEYYLS